MAFEAIAFTDFATAAGGSPKLFKIGEGTA
jgi:hypothetical protein